MNVKALMKRFLEEEGFKYEWGEECTCFRFQGLNVNVLFYDNIEDLLSLAVSFDTAFLLESKIPMTLSDFAVECSKCSTNAANLDMGDYGYGYIKKNNIKIPLFILVIATQHKQTNWLCIE